MELLRNAPEWLPDSVQNYLAHTSGSLGIREIARARDCHASTVLRQIRKTEALREDPLVEGALSAMEARTEAAANTCCKEAELSKNISVAKLLPNDAKLEYEASRILRRLMEKDAFLFSTRDAETAGVFRKLADGTPKLIARTDRSIAAAFVMNEWIAPDPAGKPGRYVISSVGTAKLKRLLARGKEQDPAQTDPFLAQNRTFGERIVHSYDGSGRKSYRINLAESPLSLLGRKKDKNGGFFLEPVLVEAGERLREDFEVSRVGPRVTQNWDRFLTA